MNTWQTTATIKKIKEKEQEVRKETNWEISQKIVEIKI
jgi:hypothetical protein